MGGNHPDDGTLRLLCAFLDGDVVGAEGIDELLKRDPEAARALATMAVDETHLREASPDPFILWHPREHSERLDLRRKGVRRRMALIATAAAVLSLSAILTWMALAGDRPVFVVEGIKGTVTVGSGDSRAPAREGMEIAHRVRIETGSSGTVTLRMIGQKTTLTLFPNSSATVPRRFGNDTALILDRGSLEADVAKQKKGERLALSSQLARVSVIGTRFTFGADPELSSVNVSEGTVDMRSPSGKGGKVPAGSGMNVTADSLTRFGDMEWKKRHTWAVAASFGFEKTHPPPGQRVFNAEHVAGILGQAVKLTSGKSEVSLNPDLGNHFAMEAWFYLDSEYNRLMTVSIPERVPHPDNRPDDLPFVILKGGQTLFSNSAGQTWGKGLICMVPNTGGKDGRIIVTAAPPEEHAFTRVASAAGTFPFDRWVWVSLRTDSRSGSVELAVDGKILPLEGHLAGGFPTAGPWSIGGMLTGDMRINQVRNFEGKLDEAAFYRIEGGF